MQNILHMEQQAKPAQKSNKKEFDEVETNIEKLDSDLQEADAVIQEINKQLEKVLSATSKYIQTKFAQSKMQPSKRKCREEQKEKEKKSITLIAHRFCAIWQPRKCCLV